MIVNTVLKFYRCKDFVFRKDTKIKRSAVCLVKSYYI